MGDGDGDDSDFLAVFDMHPRSATYGEVLTTLQVGLSASLPHHTEYELATGGQYVFANAHHAEEVLLFDLSEPLEPTIARRLDRVPPLRYPHDMVRLPSGNVLIGYLRSDGPSPFPADSTRPGGHGGLAEFTPDGDLVRSASAADPVTDVPIRPYSFATLPDIDRLVVTSAPMMEPYSADVVQIWRLSTLELIRTIDVPTAYLPDGTPLVTSFAGEERPAGHRFPFEPRVMRDGSVLFNAYGCGLYRLTGLDSDAPTIQNVHTVEVPRSSELGACGIPVLAGDFWVMTVGAARMVVVLDVADPARPREVARLHTPDDFAPHWLAKDPYSDRLVVGAENGGEDRMLIAIIDAQTGELAWDETLRERNGLPGIDFRRSSWPHGDTGEAFGHAALFGH